MSTTTLEAPDLHFLPSQETRQSPLDTSIDLATQDVREAELEAGANAYLAKEVFGNPAESQRYTETQKALAQQAKRIEQLIRLGHG